MITLTRMFPICVIVSGCLFDALIEQEILKNLQAADSLSTPPPPPAPSPKEKTVF